MNGQLLFFPWRRYLSPDEGRVAGERVLATPLPERAARGKELLLEEPSTILWLLHRLNELRESEPANVREEAEFLYCFLRKPKRKIGVLDERTFFLGEAALVATIVCRLLSRRDEAYRWLDRSEAGFRLSAKHVEDLSRLTYQKLALYVEERRFDEVLDLVDDLFDTFVNCEMAEEAIKTRFLQGAALRETGKLEEAIEVFEKIREWCRSLADGEKLFAMAANNLVLLYAAVRKPEQALCLAQEAAPVFRRLNNVFGLAKLHWAVGDALRAQRKLAEAIRTYREAQSEFAGLGMRADVASLHLVVADLLLELGQEPQAEWEVRAALPVITEEKMVPEGFAALSLLQQSVKARKLDRRALRELHGFFRHDR